MSFFHSYPTNTLLSQFSPTFLALITFPFLFHFQNCLRALFSSHVIPCNSNSNLPIFHLPLLSFSIPYLIPIRSFFPGSKNTFPFWTVAFLVVPSIICFLTSTLPWFSFHDIPCIPVLPYLLSDLGEKDGGGGGGGGGGGRSNVLGGIIFYLFPIFNFIFHDLVPMSVTRRSTSTCYFFAATSNSFSANNCLDHPSWSPRVTNLFVLYRSEKCSRSFRSYPNFLG